MVTIVGRKASSGPSFSQLDGVAESSSPLDLDEVLERADEVCETCDGHQVEETRYFLC